MAADPNLEMAAGTTEVSGMPSNAFVHERLYLALSLGNGGAGDEEFTQTSAALIEIPVGIEARY